MRNQNSINPAIALDWQHLELALSCRLCCHLVMVAGFLSLSLRMPPSPLSRRPQLSKISLSPGACDHYGWLLRISELMARRGGNS